jgi:hypothetical protein
MKLFLIGVEGRASGLSCFPPGKRLAMKLAMAGAICEIKKLGVTGFAVRLRLQADG